MNENFKDFFKWKRITVMGLGLLGRGVGDALFLARCGAKVLVTDKKNAEELAPSIARLKRFSNVQFRLGEHDEKDFRNADMVIKAAGVPFDSPYIKTARKNKVPVYMSTALFVKLLPPGVTVIGITGTRGKTTTSFMIYEIIKQFKIYDLRFKNKKRKPSVYLGGNVQGISTLALLPKVKSGDFVVLELDSWQLQGFRDLKISPQVAVFTTFFPDHMNYYGGDMRKYFTDKAAIFTIHDTHSTIQKKNVFVVSEQAMTAMKKWEPKHAKRAIVASAEDVPKNWKLKILGEHNRSNAACALAVADALGPATAGLGVPRAVIKKAVESFRGVPGRLELVRESRGVKIYNDTTATTPEATIAALRALSRNSAKQNAPAYRQTGNKRGKRYSNILQNIRISVEQSEREKTNIILIIGGADKGLDMGGLVREIPKHCKAVVLLAGTGTERLKHESRIMNYESKKETHNSLFVIHNSIQHYEAKDLKDAFRYAFETTKFGDIILFSPAFASFGMFKNEYDRGEQFNRIIKKGR